MNGGNSGFYAFVAVLATGAVQGLLQIIGGYYAENYGFVEFQAYVYQAFGHGVVNVIVVLGFASNYYAQADHGVYLQARC